jgi:hypothetical protein
MEEKMASEVEQLEVQLAGCMTAALGWAKDPPKRGDYGWSPAFQDVLNLRAKYEAQRKILEAGRDLVQSAFAHVSHGGPTRADAERWLKQVAFMLEPPQEPTHA